MKAGKAMFTQGAIEPMLIADAIRDCGRNTSIGASQIFIGQVRSDVKGGKEVKAIVYSAYEEMAKKELQAIIESAHKEFNTTSILIVHSIGHVGSGGISLFVLVTAAHREAAFEASRTIVEALKAKVPIFGKEIFHDDSYDWKQNR